MADLYLDPTYARAHNREVVQTIPKVRAVSLGVAADVTYLEIECDDQVHRVAISIFERLVLP